MVRDLVQGLVFTMDCSTPVRPPPALLHTNTCYCARQARGVAVESIHKRREPEQWPGSRDRRRDTVESMNPRLLVNVVL